MYPTTSSVHQGDTYTLYSEHYLIAYYYTPGSGYYNPYQYYPGAGFTPGEGYAPGYSFSPGGGPPVVQQQNIYLGYTYLQFATAPPHVSSVSPQSVVRGTSGSLNLQGSSLQDDFGVFTVRALDGDSLSVAWSGQSSASLNYTIASSATEGAHRFTVSNTWGESEPVSFTVTAPPSPSFSPPLLPPLNPCAVTSSPQAGYSSILSTGTTGGSGTMSVSFSGTAFSTLSLTVPYGPYSTPSSIATNIAALVTKNFFQYGLTAKAFGSNIVYTGVTVLGNVSNVATGVSFTTSTSSTAAATAESACGSAPSLPSNYGSNPCSYANPLNLDYSQKYYNGNTQSVKDHIIEKHIEISPGKSRYASSANLGSADIFSNIVRFHNRITLLFGTRTGGGGTTLILEFTYPNFQILGSAFKGIGYGQNGNIVRTNRLLVEDHCKTVITSYPLEP